MPDAANGETAMPDHPKPEAKRPAIALNVLLATALFVFIYTFSLLSSILLSLLLILLISLAVNPVISRLRAWTGGAESARRGWLQWP